MDGFGWGQRGGRVSRGRGMALAVAAVVLFCCGAPLATTAAARTMTAVGLTGVSGTIKIAACVRTPGRRPEVAYCTGLFTSDDGKVTDPDATLEADRVPGEDVTVRRTAPGTYALGGAAAALGWSAVTFLGLGAIVASLLCTATWRRHPAPAALLSRLLGLLCAAVLACAAASALGELATAV